MNRGKSKHSEQQPEIAAAARKQRAEVLKLRTPAHEKKKARKVAAAAMKKAEEMHVPSAPGTPAPAHAERNHPTPQARMPHELSPTYSLVPMVTQRSDVPHLTTAHAGHALLCVCAASARLGIFGELGDPSHGSVTPASETWLAGRLGVCRAERIRRRLGLLGACS